MKSISGAHLMADSTGAFEKMGTRQMGLTMVGLREDALSSTPARISRIPTGADSSSEITIHEVLEVAKDVFYSDIDAIKSELDNLRKEVERLKAQACATDDDEIVIRDIPYKQAKDEIKAFFKDHHGESIDPTDIEERLGIDFDMAVQACEELVAEGEIKPL